MPLLSNKITISVMKNLMHLPWDWQERKRKMWCLSFILWCYIQ